MPRSNKFDETYDFVNQNLRSQYLFETFMQVFDWAKINARSIGYTLIVLFVLKLGWMIVGAALTEAREAKEDKYRSSRLVTPECISYGDEGYVICDSVQRPGQ